MQSNNPPQPISPRSRRELLKMMETEVNVRLDDCVCEPPLIQLDEKNPMEVGQPDPITVDSNSVSLKQCLQPERSLLLFDGSKTQLDPSVQLIEVFDRENIAGRLLILGKPGSGKTRTLLELASDLIQRAQQQSINPIPVLFELSAWKNDKQTFVNWLANDLKFRHNIPKALTRKWIKTGQFLPLLDGLDELGLTRQKLCIQKINQFLEGRSSQFPLVICCRQQEYMEGEAILETLGGVVCLQPLSEKQIENYLKQLECWHLWQPIKDDQEGLLELAKRPLLLKLIPLVYPQGLKRLGRYFSDPKKRQEYQKQCCQELFDAYIKRGLQKFHNHQRYTPKDVKHWLVWLANTLKEQNETEFWLEKMQPSLLETIQQKRQYKIICGLIGLLTGGLIGAVIGGLNSGLAFGLVGGLFSAFKNQIEFAETSSFYWKTEKDWLLLGLGLALIIGLIVWLIVGLMAWQVNFLIFWLVFGMLSGISTALIVARNKEDEIRSRNQPNQGIRESAKNAIAISLISLPAGMLLYALLRIADRQAVEPLRIIASGVALGLFLGIGYGGLACIQHFVLRLVLCWSGSIPWNYAHFLSDAAESRFIKQVGGRYRFIHNMLRDRFTQMPDSW
ncbi:MAG TPA: hypothetical protein DCP31_31260 [Cyanobacteria bacterium UBA8543]|nr:hypothetical protein [Cyanobacteria bacterium UBA8543]